MKELKPDKLGTVRGVAMPFWKPNFTDIGVCEFMTNSFDLSRDNIVDVYSTVGHDPKQRFGGIGERTLRLWQDEDNLWCEFDFLDTPAGRRAWEKYRLGLVRGVSITYERIRGHNGYVEDDVNPCHGQLCDRITRAQLCEVSLISRPAMRETLGTLKQVG